MIGFIRSKFLGEPSPKSENRIEAYSETTSSNPINELQILEGHTDIVRLLTKVDEMRIASGGDDGQIILWNRMTGEKVMILKGHTLPITCMILLERYKLLSGSADKTMRMWDLKTGSCIKTLKGHEGSVKCIVPLTGKFCSGSNDRQLLIWKNDGEFSSKIERREEDNIQCLLSISGNRLVTGSNSSLLLVYKIDASKVQILAYHRESVRCLVRVSSILFASGSMDGAVVLWNTESLTPIKILNNPEKYRNDDRVYIYNIKYLLPLGERYIAAAIGNGFKIYDVDTTDCVMDCSNVHEAEVTCLVSIYEGLRIVSCSADACIKIWGTSQKINFRSKREKEEEKNSKKKSHKFDPICIGEMWAHTDCINHLLAFLENSFASCSSDCSVILWKDGRVESELRNVYASAVIQQQNMDLDRNKVNIDDTDKTSSLIIQMKHDNHISTFPNEYIPEKNESNSSENKQIDIIENLNNISDTQNSNDLTQNQPSKLPEYIFAFAERLRKEKKLKIEQISSNLRQLGHSETIVQAVMQKQISLAEEEHRNELLN